MILILQILSVLLTHDIHLTKAQVDVNVAEKSVQVSMHIFLDDLETVIQNETGFTEKMHLGTEKEVPQGDSLLAVYLSNHFLITTNDQPLSFSYVGKENSNDLLAVWCYFEFPLSDIPTKNLTLTNNVLMELYADQQNIITLQGPNKKRDYLLFQIDESTASFSYQTKSYGSIIPNEEVSYVIMLKKIFILPIRFYQSAISPHLGNNCRYTPTCSQYMIESINEWGIFKGIWLGLKRIGRCHPWAGHGHDPVPKKKVKK